MLIKSVEEKEPESLKESFPPFILFKKTLFKDVATLPKFIGSILLMLFAPLMVLLFFNPAYANQDTSIFNIGIGLAYFMFTSSIIFSIIISMATAPLISYEIREGIMLMLISKPISRTNIILSKFIAVFLFGLIINFLSLSIICLLAYAIFPFYDILPFFLAIFVYSLMILIFFECLTIGLSCILRKPRNVLIIPVGFIIFLFLVFLMFKPMLMLGGEPNNYEKYNLYIFDLSYHFANFFFLLVDNLLKIEPNIIFVMYGVARYTEGWDIEYTDYLSPIGSLILLISIATIMFLLGYFYFRKKDINR